MGYLRSDVLFVKRFRPEIGLAHPDFNCNAEVYCNDRFIELETLAPMVQLEPGQSVSHCETWEVYVGVDMHPAMEKLGVDRFVGVEGMP
jgi:hypothetical protein